MCHALIGNENFCDFLIGEWTVFQRRVSAHVDFFRDWASYKVGFGDPSGNFWLGLDKLHELAKPGAGAKLRIDMKVRTGESYFAEYSKFEVENEAAGYRLTVSGFTGTLSLMIFMSQSM